MRYVSMLLLCLCSVAYAAKPDPHRYVKWLGPQTCAECHEDEAKIWRQAHHSTSFKTMPRSKDGKKIAKQLGVSRIKMSQECGVCHFSYTVKNNTRLQAVAGVSCESCHGAAQEWNVIHQDYGGKNVTAQQESEQHKAERWRKAEQAGMIRPIRKYTMFKQCYECHTIADEALLNKTDHPVGDEFELVKWSNGEVRHNVWYSKGRTNTMRSREQLRIRYVLGQALAVEYALRGLAKATKEGKYTTAMIKRIEAAKEQLGQINSAVKIAELTNILDVVTKTELTYQSKDALTAAADKIADFIQQFLDKANDVDLKAIDKMLPTTFQGKAQLSLLWGANGR